MKIVFVSYDSQRRVVLSPFELRQMPIGRVGFVDEQDELLVEDVVEVAKLATCVLTIFTNIKTELAFAQLDRIQLFETLLLVVKRRLDQQILVACCIVT